MSFSKVPFTTEMNPRSPFDDTAAATGNALKAVDEGFNRFCLEGIYAEYITKDSKVHRDDTSAYKKGHVLLDVDTLKAILLDGGLQLGHSKTAAEMARGADIAVRFFQSMKGIDTAKLAHIYIWAKPIDKAADGSTIDYDRGVFTLAQSRLTHVEGPKKGKIAPALKDTDQTIFIRKIPCNGLTSVPVAAVFGETCMHQGALGAMSKSLEQTFVTTLQSTLEGVYKERGTAKYYTDQIGRLMSPDTEGDYAFITAEPAKVNSRTPHVVQIFHDISGGKVDKMMVDQITRTVNYFAIHLPSQLLDILEVRAALKIIFADRIIDTSGFPDVEVERDTPADDGNTHMSGGGPVSSTNVFFTEHAAVKQAFFIQPVIASVIRYIVNPKAESQVATPFMKHVINQNDLDFMGGHNYTIKMPAKQEYRTHFRKAIADVATSAKIKIRMGMRNGLVSLTLEASGDPEDMLFTLRNGVMAAVEQSRVNKLIGDDMATAIADSLVFTEAKNDVGVSELISAPARIWMDKSGLAERLSKMFPGCVEKPPTADLGFDILAITGAGKACEISASAMNKYFGTDEATMVVALKRGYDTDAAKDACKTIAKPTSAIVTTVEQLGQLVNDASVGGAVTVDMEAVRGAINHLQLQARTEVERQTAVMVQQSEQRLTDQMRQMNELSMKTLADMRFEMSQISAERDRMKSERDDAVRRLDGQGEKASGLKKKGSGKGGKASDGTDEAASTSSS